MTTAPPSNSAAAAALTAAPDAGAVLDEAAEQRELACRRSRCAGLGAACFASCDRHGHADPEADDRCLSSCREAYGVTACERECETAARPTP